MLRVHIKKLFLYTIYILFLLPLGLVFALMVLGTFWEFLADRQFDRQNALLLPRVDVQIDMGMKEIDPDTLLDEAHRIDWDNVCQASGMFESPKVGYAWHLAYYAHDDKDPYYMKIRFPHTKYGSIVSGFAPERCAERGEAVLRVTENGLILNKKGE